MNNSKTIYVFDDFNEEKPILLGTLFVDNLKGEENFSFEYDEKWIEKYSTSVVLSPELMPYKGRQFPLNNNFGMIEDASPDRWGRTLMNKKERNLAKKEGRKARKLLDSDYLLSVYDLTRSGGLRFKLELDGPFISEDKQSSIPPWTTLHSLEEASRNFEKDEDDNNDKWLNQLINPGSSLGGARPKANILDPNGELWIAKFPSKNDDYDIGAWEKVAHDLAKMCGLRVCESKIEKFSNFGSTFLIKRFDRKKGKRIHFASAMTLLCKTDGSSSEDGTSYLDIASFIKAYSIKPIEDLNELYKRIVFNMAISNTDDHLRNHGFLFKDGGWSLSPIYDINPVNYGDELSLTVIDENNKIDVNLALKSHNFYGLDDRKAMEITSFILNTVKNNWEKLALQYGISRNQIENMRPAFGECYKLFN